MLAHETTFYRSVINYPERHVSNVSQGFLQREADQAAPKAILRQLRRSPTPPLSPISDFERDSSTYDGINSQGRQDNVSSPTSPSTSFNMSPTRISTSWKEPQVCAIGLHAGHVSIFLSRSKSFELLNRRTLCFLWRFETARSQ